MCCEQIKHGVIIYKQPFEISSSNKQTTCPVECIAEDAMNAEKLQGREGLETGALA